MNLPRIHGPGSLGSSYLPKNQRPLCGILGRNAFESSSANQKMKKFLEAWASRNFFFSLLLTKKARQIGRLPAYRAYKLSTWSKSSSALVSRPNMSMLTLSF